MQLPNWRQAEFLIVLPKGEWWEMAGLFVTATLVECSRAGMVVCVGV